MIWFSLGMRICLLLLLPFLFTDHALQCTSIAKQLPGLLDHTAYGYNMCSHLEVQHTVFSEVYTCIDIAILPVLPKISASPP